MFFIAKDIRFSFGFDSGIHLNNNNIAMIVTMASNQNR